MISLAPSQGPGAPGPVWTVQIKRLRPELGAVKYNSSHLYQVHYTYAVFCNRENFTVYKKNDIYHCTILVQCYL